MLNLKGLRESRNLKVNTSRKNLSQLINESWNLFYEVTDDKNLHDLVESHLSDIKSNPSDVKRLSENLSVLKALLVESRSGKRLSEEELADTSGLDRSIENDVGDLKTDRDSQDVSCGEKETKKDIRGALLHEDEDLDDDRLDVEDATIDQCKMVNPQPDEDPEFDAPKADPEEVKKFAENSKGKVFRRVLSKPDSFNESIKEFNLKESITAYKAANSAMTQLAIEYEHNDNFRETFSVLSRVIGKATNSILESIRTSTPIKAESLNTLKRFNKALSEDSQDDIEDFVDWVDNEYQEIGDDKVPKEDISDEDSPLEIDLPDEITSEEEALEVVRQIIDTVYPGQVDIDSISEDDEDGVPDDMEDITPEESEDLKKYLCLLRGCEEGSEEAEVGPTEDEITAMEEHLIIRRKKMKESQYKHLSRIVKESSSPKGRKLKKRGN